MTTPSSTRDRLRLFFVNMHRLWGGQSTAVLILASELKRRGHDVIVAGVPGSELMQRAEKAGITTFAELELMRGFRPLSFARDQRRLRRLWKQFDPDIILTNGSQDTWACGIARLWTRSRARLVRWRHNSFDVANHVFNRWLYRDLIDHVVVSSGAIAPILTGTGLVTPDRVTVFPPTTKLDAFLSGAPSAGVREQLNVGNGTLTLSVGRLAPEKGHDTLVRAWRQVAARRPDAKLAIVGLGSQEEPLKKIITELKLEQNVFLLGFRNDVPSLYADADLAVLAPVAGESFGIALLEAYASGKACVATDVGGVGDLVVNGQTGFLVPPRDEARIAGAILECLEDRSLRDRLSAAGKSRVLAQFTPEKLGDTAETLFYHLFRRE